MAILLAGCNTTGIIRSRDGTALAAPQNAASQSSIATGEQEAEAVVPKGSRVKVTEEAAMPAQPATANTPAAPAQPATKITEYELAADMPLRSTASSQEIIVAPPRAPDQSVALKKADNEARAPLLYVGIGLAVIGLLVAFVLKYPVIGMKISLLGGGGAFAAWKIADVPSWLWAVGVLMALVAAFFYMRGQWDADGNGVPDILEKKTRVVK
jgi:hypothetical protein